MRVGWLTVLCALPMLALPGPAVAGEPGYVRYYQVTAGYQGKAENLTELANRFLDDPDRADDIYQLNAGRTQPDGKALASQQQSLTPGWLLILPWDAYGDEIQYGHLPSEPAQPAHSGQADQKCAGGASVSGADSTWATARLAVDQAWERGRGSGVLVAVVDSGIDASLPELAGRVAAGADVTTGGGRGDADCLGSGTGMASVIAAQGDSMTGVAPQSTVLPVRIVANTPSAEPAKVVTGIEVAVSAGATVIALGSYADIGDPAIAAAIEAAIAHDVLVVAEAPSGGAAADPAREGLLRVAGVGPDGQQAAEYTAGAVELTAPGIDVPTLGAGRTGLKSSSGTRYAVAYVAGTAALVRAARPELDARHVAHRIQSTAKPGAPSVPTAEAGWGMVNPRAAVMVSLAEERERSGPPTSAPGPRRAVLAMIFLAGLAGAGLLVRRTRAASTGSGRR